MNLAPFGRFPVSLLLLHRDFVIRMLSLAASEVRDYKIPNQPPNKKWKSLYDKYTVLTGLGNPFFFGLFCFAIDILSLTGQNLDYSQVLDDAPRLQAFPKKELFETDNPKLFAAQEQRTNLRICESCRLEHAQPGHQTPSFRFRRCNFEAPPRNRMRRSASTATSRTML